MAIPRVTGPSVELKPLTVPFQSIQTSADAFGGILARATGQLAQGLGNLSQQTSAIATDMKVQDDRRAVKNADNMFSAFLREVEFGATDDQGNVKRRGFYDMKGDEAVSSSPLTKKEVQEKMKEILGTLGNQSQKDAFQAAAMARSETSFGNIDKYTMDQRRVAADTVDDVRIKEAMDNLAAHPFDRKVRGQSLIIATEAVTAMSQRNDWAPEVTISKMQEAQSAILKAGIESALQQNPTAALALYNEAKGSIDGSLRPEIETLLKDAVVRQRSQMETDAIMSRPDWSPAKQLKVARAIEDPLVRDETVRRVKNRIAENEALETQRAKDVADTLYSKVWGGETMDNIFAENPNLAREAMKNFSLMANLRSIEDTLAGDENFGRVTDVGTQTKLELMDPSELATINPLEYKNKLTKTDYGSLLDIIRGAKAAEAAKSAKDPKDYQLFQRAENALKDFAPAALDWGGSDQNDSKRRVQHRVHYEMTTWVADQIDAGHPPTVPELEQKAAELMTKITGGWFSGINLLAAQEADLTPEQREKAYVDPETAPRHLVEELEARGLPMSEDVMGRVLFARITKDRDLEAKAIGLTDKEQSEKMLDPANIPDEWRSGFTTFLDEQGISPTEDLIRALAYTQIMGDTAGQMTIIRSAKKAQ